MATKESRRRTGTPRRRWTGLLRARRKQLRTLLVPFACSAALTRAELLGGVPFSLAWVAAAGDGVRGASALAGALLGYVALMPVAQALRYSAAAILIYTVGISFCDLRVYRKPGFLAACTGLIAFLTGFVYQAGGVWGVEQMVRLASEALLAVWGCLFLRRMGISAEKGLDRQGLAFCGVLVCLTLGGFHPGLGGSAAALCALLAARAGVGSGAAIGALAGLAVGLGSGGTPLLGAVLSAAGALAGTRAQQHRLESVLLFGGGGVLCALWVHAGSLTALECLGAAVVYSFLPEQWLKGLDQAVQRGNVAALRPVPRSSALERSRHRLEGQAAALRTLCEDIGKELERGEIAEESGVIFQRTAERVCTGCFLYPVCWKREYAGTCRSLTGVLDTMLEQGSAELNDYPDPFRRRCGQMEHFVRAANEELFGYWARQRCRARIQSSRAAVCRQYSLLSRLLSAAADTLGEEAEEDRSGAASVERALEQRGVEARCSLQVDRRGCRTLEVRGKHLSALAGEEGIALFSGALGVRMEPTESFRVRKGEQLEFRQCPPLSATVAVASRRKREGQSNGDNGLWFRDEEGWLWVALCDGMGSGAAAARDNQLLTELLKDFLRAGVAPAAALSTLSGAMGLIGEQDGGFSTVDLLRLDLFSGAAELYKLGGAPTYLRRGGLVSRLTGSALPAGLEREFCADEHRFRLSAEDFLLLVTDGVTDGEGDQWIRSLLGQYQGESPRELAQAVLASPAAGREDDRTVVAVRLTRRKGG